MMLKKYRFHSAVIILLSTSLLFSFLLEKDALANIKFGKVPVDDFNEQMIQDSRFKELAEGKEFFRYYIDGKYPVVAYPNERYRYSGALRELQLSLGGDTVYSSYGNSYHPCCGQRLKSEVDDIYKLYCSWYGNPDSLEYKYYYQFEDEHFEKMKKLGSGALPFTKSAAQKKADSLVPPKMMAIWNLNGFKLIFKTDFPEKDILFNSQYYYPSFHQATITYEMIGFEKEIAHIQDSIKKRFRPKDLITMNHYNLRWIELKNKDVYAANTQVLLTVSNIGRKDNEEPRGVSAIRFEVIIKDAFNEEFCRIKNLTITFPEALFGGYGSDGLIGTPTNKWDVNYTYNNNNVNDEIGVALEKARLYSKSNKLKTEVIITAIVFNDGTVLK